MFCCFRGEEESTAPRRLKMVVVGDGDCGKTCLLYRFAFDEFFTRYIPTVFEVEAKTVYYKEQEVNLVMYDTAGQNDYDRLRPFSYDETDVMVICFSVDNPDSLDNVLLNWVPEVRYFCGNIPIILVGNKQDLRHAHAHDTTSGTPDKTSSEKMEKRLSKNTVSFDEGQAVATKMGAVAYFETSAKTGEGTDAVFEAVIRSGMEITRKKKGRQSRWKRW